MDIVFNKKWFEKYQSRLLWLLNTPIIRIWFRFIMRIHKFDCDKKINQITPNSFSYGAKKVGKKIKLTTDFRTHDKFSKRLYFAFKPFWYLLHFFDWAMLDRVEELTEYSFGFSTLTQFPGSIGVDNPVNGRVGRFASEVWGTIRAGAGNFSSSETSLQSFVYFDTSTTSTHWESMIRSIYCFDTSSIGSTPNISATTLSLFGNLKVDNGTAVTPNIDIYLATPAATTSLANGDYGQIGSTSQTGSPITYAGWSSSAYNVFTFNVYTGVSKTGISKFGARNANYDVANSAPTWSASSQHYFYGYYSDRSGASPCPKLVVTYSLPVTGGGAFLFNML